MATIRIIQTCDTHYTVEAKSEVPNIPDFIQIDRTVLEIPEALQAAIDHSIGAGIHRKDIQIIADQESTEWTLEALDEDRNARDAMAIPPGWKLPVSRNEDFKVEIIQPAKWQCEECHEEYEGEIPSLDGLWIDGNGDFYDEVEAWHDGGEKHPFDTCKAKLIRPPIYFNCNPKPKDTDV